MTEKLEFGNKKWMDLVKSLIIDLTQKAGEQAKNVDFSMCEVYSNAPKHLAVEKDRVAWHFRIKGNKVSFGIGEVDDVDMKVIGDYELLHQISTLIYENNNPSKASEILKEPTKSGKFKFVGDMSKGPVFLSPLHNLIAERTK